MKADANNVKLALTEFDLATRYVEVFGRIAHSAGRFRKYGNGVWDAVDDLEIEREVGQIVNGAYHSGSGVKPTLTLTRNVTGLLKSINYEKPDVWDLDPDLLVFGNVALDTRTGETLEHSPDHKATIRLPYDYDPTATAPTWGSVLARLLAEDEARFFQEFAGYSLTSSTAHQMALWLVGPPAGGKSTLIAGLETMLGGMAGALNLAQINSNFGLASIPGKTLLTCTEVPRQHMRATDVLNALITGDTVTVNEKYVKAHPHRNTAKLVWAMNSMPGLYDGSNGLFRRIKVLPIPKAIPEGERDPMVIERVRLEGPGIANWALEGLDRLNARGRFEYPQSVKDATGEYAIENDLQAQFLEERCERAPSEQLFYTPEYTVYAANLAKAFNEWAHAHGHTGKWAAPTLAGDWQRLGLKRGKRTRRGWPYHGVKLA